MAITLDDIHELMPEAYRETMKRYSDTGDVEGALLFYSAAIGLLARDPTKEDLEWAEQIVSKLGIKE